MLVSDFIVNSILKKGISVECMECLNKDVKKKKKEQILYTVGRDDQIATSVKFFDTTHKFMDSMLI